MGKCKIDFGLTDEQKKKVVEMADRILEKESIKLEDIEGATENRYERAYLTFWLGKLIVFKVATMIEISKYEEILHYE